MSSLLPSPARASYQRRRAQVETYFDRTAADAWARLTSDAPVSGIRATVRAGRSEMRQTLLSWLPQDLRGARILDAGCGTGVLAVEAARRGADVVAIDLSPTLVGLAQQRIPAGIDPGRLHFEVGDGEPCFKLVGNDAGLFAVGEQPAQAAQRLGDVLRMLGGADAQPFLDRRVEVADRDAAHGGWCSRRLHDFIITNDCDDVNLYCFSTHS